MLSSELSFPLVRMPPSVLAVRDAQERHNTPFSSTFASCDEAGPDDES
jgi:hypothetical protein